MDDRGRLAQSLNWIAGLRARPPTVPPTLRARQAVRSPDEPQARSRASRYGEIRALAMSSPHVAALVRATRRQRVWTKLLRTRIPRGAGIAAAAVIVSSGLCYGVVKGDHLPAIVDAFHDARDQAGNALGFRITSLTVSGHRHMSREEVIATAGVTGRTSLLFLDVDAARERLKTNPWIADATLLKFYPGQLQIGIRERTPFALWQKDRRVAVIADDGTVLETYAAPQLFTLPLVVGRGAEARAKAFLALLDRYPKLREQVRASILVGERRWNLRLRNGLDIRLPETDPASALDRLAALDRDVRLLTRDITVVDLRLPDRVTVRLSERAAEKRLESRKGGKKKPKTGGKA
jgi:cell division protein FtsQ